MTTLHSPFFGDFSLANDQPLAFFAGPCAIESRAHALETAFAVRGRVPEQIVLACRPGFPVHLEQAEIPYGCDRRTGFDDRVSAGRTGA